MDDYVSKPVELDELQRVLERWVASGVGHAPLDDPPANPVNAEEQFDRDVVAVLRSLTREGEPDAFVSLTMLFLSSGGLLLEALRDAIARHAAESVGGIAHTLNGSAGNLGGGAVGGWRGSVGDLQPA